jgi:hypothetical protein
LLLAAAVVLEVPVAAVEVVAEVLEQDLLQLQHKLIQ